MGSPAARRLGLRCIGAVAVVVACAWSVWDVHWSEVAHELARTDVWWSALALIISVFALFAQALRWQALVGPISQAARIGDSFTAIVVGLVVSQLMPLRSGVLARLEWFTRRSGLPRATIAASLIQDHLVNALGFLFMLPLLALTSHVPTWTTWTAWAVLAGVAIAIGVPVAASRAGIAGTSPDPGGPRFLRPLRHTIAAVGSRASPKAYGLSLAASLLDWGVETVAVATTLRAVEVDLSLLASLQVLVAINIAVAVPLIPGNVGTQESAVLVALVHLGVAKERALAFALCYRAVQLASILASGLAVAASSRSQSWRSRLVAGGVIDRDAVEGTRAPEELTK